MLKQGSGIALDRILEGNLLSHGETVLVLTKIDMMFDVLHISSKRR